MTGRHRDRPRPEPFDANFERDKQQPIAHTPVLVDAMLAALVPHDDAVYVDATFGTGGYSVALLGAAQCRVVGIDRDPDAIRRGHELAQRLGGRLTIIEGRFGEMAHLLTSVSAGPIAGIAFDLGVSSAQLDTPERGFSFRFDGPLDMRMSGEVPSAADLIASLSERRLAELIRDFGEERFARRIARAITGPFDVPANSQKSCAQPYPNLNPGRTRRPGHSRPSGSPSMMNSANSIAGFSRQRSC